MWVCTKARHFLSFKLAKIFKDYSNISVISKHFKYYISEVRVNSAILCATGGRVSCCILWKN